MGERTKMRDFVVTAGLLFLFFTLTLSEESGEAGKRGGKIFYVTTTSSISTVSTATYCWVQETMSFAQLTCGKKKRKKRAVKVIADKSGEDLDIQPSSILPEEDNREPESEVMSSQGEDRKVRELLDHHHLHLHHHLLHLHPQHCHDRVHAKWLDLCPVPCRKVDSNVYRFSPHNIEILSLYLLQSVKLSLRIN